MYLQLNASAETQSVGQDNIGYIVNSLVDFYSLSLSEDYEGGVLCIDEVDASLHPSAQVNLFNLLNRLSNELNLQIFLTSHSLTILKEIISLKEKNADQYQLVYFKGVSTPSIMKFNSYRLLKADLFQELTFKKPETKVYCEDKMTKDVFELLVNAAELLDLNFKLPPYKIIPIFLGADQLTKLPKSDTHFSNVAIILDGDANSKKKIKIEEYMKDSTIVKSLTPRELSKNFVSLPEYLSPEGYLYSIIYELVENDRDHYKFWRTLDEDPETALYSSDKIKERLIIKDSELCLDALKAESSDLLTFSSESNMLSYYYSTKQEDLLRWIKRTQAVFEHVSNRLMASRI
ncbi:AAA family ATPase [Enterococcus dongliensis]|uniref:AAA family ATPase n=1 Tax=Enterococcus dongliensis TaxID=2559925 RepID=UPI002890031F|nr:AAA family ATPase [Enterococcus dongliensis]MDT2674107.1 AAA family ATPase [Enterococcus dongliensis]